VQAKLAVGSPGDACEHEARDDYARGDREAVRRSERGRVRVL